jgi:hypothetical protein
MGSGNVHDMDIVTHAATVSGRITGSAYYSDDRFKYLKHIKPSSQKVCRFFRTNIALKYNNMYD